MTTMLLKDLDYDPQNYYRNLIQNSTVQIETVNQYDDQDLVMEYFKNQNFRFSDILLIKAHKIYKQPNFQFIKKFENLDFQFDKQKLDEIIVDQEIVDILQQSIIKTFKNYIQGDQNHIFQQGQILQNLDHVQLVQIHPELIKQILQNKVKYVLLENFNENSLQDELQKLLKKNKNLTDEDIEQKSTEIVQGFFTLNLMDKLNTILKQNSIKIFKSFEILIDQTFQLPTNYQYIYNQRSITIFKENDQLKLVLSNNLKENVTTIDINQQKSNYNRYVQLNDRKMNQILNEFKPDRIIIVVNENIKVTEVKSLYITLNSYRKKCKKQFELKIVDNEIIKEIYKISSSFTSQQNFYNMYFCNPIDLTILKYNKELLQNIKTPIDIDFLDYLISNYLKYKFLEKGIVLDYIKNQDYCTILHRIIIDAEFQQQIKQASLSNLQKIELDKSQNQYYFFYKKLNKKSNLNYIKFEQNEQKIIQAIQDYIKDFSQISMESLIKGMLSEIFYLDYKISSIQYFTQMINSLRYNLIQDQNKLKLITARFFLDLYPNSLQKLKNSKYDQYCKKQFFSDLLVKQNLKIEKYQIIKFKIVQITDDYVKGYYKNIYSVYLSKDNCGINKRYKMKDYYSINEYIKGNVFSVCEKNLEIDIQQNLSDKERVKQNYEYQMKKKYNLNNYQFKIKFQQIKLISRIFIKRNFDFLEIDHKKFFNKSVQILKEKLIKQIDDQKISYLLAPAERNKKYKIQAKVYLNDIEQFITVPIYYDKKQQENFDKNVINMESINEKDDNEYYYINNKEQFLCFDKFIEYFENVINKILEVSQNKYFNQSIEINDELIEFKFNNKQYFFIEAIYKKNNLKYSSEIMIGSQFYYKEKQFKDMNQLSDFIIENRESFNDKQYISKIIEIQFSNDLENQTDKISAINSQDSFFNNNSFYNRDLSNKTSKSFGRKQNNNRNNYRKFQKQNLIKSDNNSLSNKSNPSSRSNIKNKSNPSSKSNNSNISNPSSKSNNQSIQVNRRKKNNWVNQNNDQSNQNKRGNNKQKGGWGNNNNKDQKKRNDNIQKGNWKKQDFKSEKEKQQNEPADRKKSGWGNNNRSKNQKKSWQQNSNIEKNQENKNFQNERKSDNKWGNQNNSSTNNQGRRQQNKWNKNNDTENNYQNKKKFNNAWSKNNKKDSNQDQEINSFKNKRVKNTGWGNKQNNNDQSNKNNKKDSNQDQEINSYKNKRVRNSGWGNKQKNNDQSNRNNENNLRNKKKSTWGNNKKTASTEPKDDSQQNKNQNNRIRQKNNWGKSNKQENKSKPRNVVWSSSQNPSQIKKQEELKDSHLLQKKNQDQF